MAGFINQLITGGGGGHFVVNIYIYIIIMGIAHQSSDPLLINLYVSKDARH